MYIYIYIACSYKKVNKLANIGDKLDYKSTFQNLVLRNLMEIRLGFVKGIKKTEFTKLDD